MKGAAERSGSGFNIPEGAAVPFTGTEARCE